MSDDSGYPVELPELLAVQVDKGWLMLVWAERQEHLQIGRIRLESDVVKHWTITPAEYQRAVWLAGGWAIAAWAIAAYGYHLWGIPGVVGGAALGGLLFRFTGFQRWLDAEHRRSTPQIYHRLRVWADGEPRDLLFVDLDELEAVEDDIHQGMRDAAFSSRIDVSGNGNAINIGGNGNVARVAGDAEPRE